MNQQFKVTSVYLPWAIKEIEWIKTDFQNKQNFKAALEDKIKEETDNLERQRLILELHNLERLIALQATEMQLRAEMQAKQAQQQDIVMEMQMKYDLFLNNLKLAAPNPEIRNLINRAEKAKTSTSDEKIKAFQAMKDYQTKLFSK